MKRNSTPASVEEIHGRIDARAHELALHHAQRLHCERGCHACCVDDLTVLPIEAERIRSRHATLLSEGTPHAPGACAFLGDEGECRIYPDRPYICRTQGLPLRWFSEDRVGEIRERRAICPLNEEGPALESLPEESCWLIGPFELELANLQAETRDPDESRVTLRGLFERAR